MNKFATTLLIVSGVLLVAAFQVSAQTAPANGIFYKISGKGLTKPSYLFGTVHVICKDDMFSEATFAKYLGETDRLVMEINLGDMNELMEAAKGLHLPEGKTLKDIMTPEQYLRVDAMIFSILGHADAYATTSPVALQVMLLSSPKELGCSSPSAYELMLMQLALAAKKPVEGLESAKFQREVAEKLPLDAQAQLLLEMAAGPEKAAEQFKKMIAVYKEQDSEKLYEFTNSQMGGTDLETPLVANRNKTWIPKIESMIKEKPTFIAVGAGHLGGKDGLVNSLRVLGYKVEAVKL